MSSTPDATLIRQQKIYNTYDVLRIYAFYRTLLSTLLLAMFLTGITREVLGNTNPRIFFYTALTYSVTAWLILIFLWRKHFQPKDEQIFAILMWDMVALLLMLQTSGGVGNGIGYLLLVCTAAGGILLRSQASIALAAVSSILLIGITLGDVLDGKTDSQSIFTAGTQGILLFVTALALSYLSNRIRSSSQEAAAQAFHAAQLQRMARLIVERMRTGIIIVNADGAIELINLAAEKLLNVDAVSASFLPLSYFPEINNQLQLWQNNPHNRAPRLLAGTQQREIRLGFARMEEGKDNKNSETLIFLEDNMTLTQEAQQLKLASLGRLTASIAHEIRNPLGAISHASQLLAESPDLANTDRRMTEIIATNTTRVNQIIENVLQLSRRRASQPEPIELNEWVKLFIADYRIESPEFALELHSEAIPINTNIDTSHLHQILSNLCNNGLRYSKAAIGEAKITLHLGIDSSSELPFIRIIDYGNGISEADQAHLFEPFFTTETSGSGLGLYISKELCEANQATLNYEKTADSYSCFKITFAHPKRLL